MDKVFASVDEAVKDIPDGASIAIGGFFTAGTPVELIQALARQGAKNLTIICQQMGPGNEDVTKLVEQGQVKKAIVNYPFYRSASRGANSPFEIAVRAGKIEVEVFPMGTFIEKMRAAGAGIGGFYTPTGVGYGGGTGQREESDQRPPVSAGVRPETGLRLRARLEGRPDGQLHLPQDSPELQSGDGQSCQGHNSPS